MKETFYFSHDYNARYDHKIKRLIAKHGYLGYGLFWAIVEDLYNNANALQTDYESIAFDLRTTPTIIESIIKDFGLFVIENGFFGSLSIEERLNARIQKSKKATESAKMRWNKCDSNANALQTQSDCNAIKESKVKESKVNRFTPPLLQDVKDFFKAKGYTEQSAIRAFNHYDLANWHDTGGKPVKNWKQKMNTVWFKPENKIPAEENPNWK